MGLRPEPARWFELLTPSETLAAAVEALARTGSAQIETHGHAPSADAVQDLRAGLGTYEQLLRKYGPYLPKDGLRPSAGGIPEELLARSLGRLTTWTHEAESVIRALEALEHERSELLLLRELVDAGGVLTGVRESGPLFRVRVAVLPAHAPELELPDAVLRRRIDGPEHTFLMLVGEPADMDEAESMLLSLEARIIEPAGETAPEQRLLEVAEHAAAQRRELERLWSAHDIRRAVADMKRLCWLSKSAPRFPHTANFSIVTGFTDDPSGERLRAELAQSEVPALLRFPPPPEGVEPPVILHNPGWARPFEKIGALLGTPSRNESDPSVVLAIVVPLLFGYMFGDVGHGLTLLVLGLALRKRFAFLAMLVPAGISAAAFGVVFGCVFTLEGVIPPLWLHPLADPLALLVGALVIGALVLLLGVALSALGSIWRGRLPIGELGLVMTFGGALAMLLDARALLIVVSGFLLSAGAEALHAKSQRWRAALVGALELVEHTLQLAVNTLSFARVGAFALAHAGLSAAVVTLSMTTTHLPVRIAILVIGNVFVLVIEGMVVSIQTTRLVLFEFFARFLQGEGRIFRPLAPPADSSA